MAKKRGSKQSQQILVGDDLAFGGMASGPLPYRQIGYQELNQIFQKNI